MLACKCAGREASPSTLSRGLNLAQQMCVAFLAAFRGLQAGLLHSKAMAAVQWEFCRGVRPTGDGVSLVPQEWQPVTNYEMILALGSGREDVFWYEGQEWHVVSADNFEMRLYQSVTTPGNNLIFRPRRRYKIILEVFASIIPRTTWVRLGSQHGSRIHTHTHIYIERDACAILIILIGVT